MSDILLPVPYIPQTNKADCLAACASMLLAYHHVQIRYKEIVKLFDTRWHGASFTNIARLARYNFDVHVDHGQPEIILPTLLDHIPIVASIQTGELSQYDFNTLHAVVIVGINVETDTIYLNDPMVPSSSHPFHLGEFELAWLAQRGRYATITPN